VKRSLFDELLLNRLVNSARTFARAQPSQRWRKWDWEIETAIGGSFSARTLIGEMDAILPSRDAHLLPQPPRDVWRCKRISVGREILAGALFCNSFGKVTPVRRRS